MSIRAITAVWDHSQHDGSKLLLMLALADFANDDAISWPSVATLARMVRLSDRQVRSLLRELEASGEIATDVAAGPGGSNLYHILLPDATKQGKPTSEGKRAAGGGKPTSANPLIVIVPSSSSRDGENQQQQKDRGKPTTGGGNSTSPPPLELTEKAAEILAAWASYGVSGDYLAPLAVRIAERPYSMEELDDILDYYEAWNQYADAGRRLLPGWLVQQFRALAALPVDAPAPLTWMDHAPPKAARPEYWRKYTATTDPNDPAAILHDYGEYYRRSLEAEKLREENPDA